MTPTRVGDAASLDKELRVTPDIAAEAAVWVTRLHGPDRSPQMERDFLAWQAESALHREAFERCTDVWQDVAQIKLATAYETGAAARAAQTHSAGAGAWRWGAVAAVMSALVLGGFMLQQGLDHDDYRTAVGEQRTLLLDDGSRVVMNTDTRVRVNFSGREREVSIQTGEAIFEVAKDPARPFIVHASGSEVVAVGTAFAVRVAKRSTGQATDLAVTMIEGQVRVRPTASAADAGLVAATEVVMHAGDRLRLTGVAGAWQVLPKLDRPNVEQVTAWKRSEVVFDAASLQDAVSEMNRYSRTPIVLLEGLGQSQLKVSGQFRAGDNMSFARAVAALYGLSVRTDAGRLVLEKNH